MIKGIHLVLDLFLPHRRPGCLLIPDHDAFIVEHAALICDGDDLARVPNLLLRDARRVAGDPEQRGLRGNCGREVGTVLHLVCVEVVVVQHIGRDQGAEGYVVVIRPGLEELHESARLLSVTRMGKVQLANVFLR